ncbi:MAG: hypothetical protein ACRDJM_05500 [Actinomycetota bacterium]
MRKARTVFTLTAALAALFAWSGSAQAIILDPVEINTIPVGSAPGAVAHYPDAGRVFVGNTGSGTVSVIDEYGGFVIRDVAVGPAPHGIAVDRQLSRVYVAIGESNQVVVLNAVNGQRLATFVVPQCTGPTGPWGIDVHPGTGTVYVACYSASQVVALNGLTGAILKAVPAFPNGGALGVVVDAATNRVYVSQFGAPEIRILDAATLEIAGRVTGGIRAGVWGLALDPITHRVAAANFFDGTIQIISGQRVVNTRGGFSGPEWIAFDSLRDRVWIPENTANRVTAWDLLTGRVIRVPISGTRPTAVAVNPAGFVYSANFGTLNVSVIAE